MMLGVFGKTEAERDQQLHNLTEMARQHGLVFHFSKCKIKQSSMKFFGLVFDAEGVHPDPERIEDIRLLRQPQTMSQLQQFLSIATYVSIHTPPLAAHCSIARYGPESRRVQMDRVTWRSIRKDKDTDLSSSHAELLRSTGRDHHAS